MTNKRRGNPRQKCRFRARSWHRPRSPFCCRVCVQICFGIPAEGFAAPTRAGTSIYLGEWGWSPGKADPGFVVPRKELFVGAGASGGSGSVVL